MEGNSGPLFGFSPDSTLLAAGISPSRSAVLNARSGSRLWELDGRGWRGGESNTLPDGYRGDMGTFSPDGTLLAWYSEREAVAKVWRV